MRMKYPATRSIAKLLVSGLTAAHGSKACEPAFQPRMELAFFPLAKAFGAFATVKLVYPVVASLAAVPAYMVVRRGPAPIAGILAMLFLPDLVVKALTGTPQGIALPLFLLALFFGMRGRRRAFVATAAAILLVHHLTGLVTMVLYYAMFVLPRSREPGFLRREWPYIAFFAAWPLYWAWTFFNTGQSYMAPILLLLVVFFGAPLAGLLYLTAPRIGRAVEWLGVRVAALSAANLLLVAGVAAAAGWSLTGLVLESPGLSTDAAANRAVVALYSGLLVLGVAAALARRHLGLTVFIAALLGLGLADLSLGCQHIFDGLRVADYALLGGVAALFAPGLSARWLGRPLLVAVATAVVVAGVLRLEPGYDRLFAHTTGQLEAARWIEANTPEQVSVASDTKMSLLILGEANRNATFEGTYWLFDGSPLRPYVATLNANYRFRDRPISYVLLSDYMLERGADVTWFSPTLAADQALLGRLDGLGERVYERGGVTIWKLAPDVISAGVATPRVDMTAELLSRLYLGFGGGPCR